MPISTLSYPIRLLRELGVPRSRPEGTDRRVSLRRQDLDERFPGLLDVLGVDDRAGGAPPTDPRRTGVTQTG